MSLYIGIDPALDNTGIVVLNGKLDVPSHFMNIKTDPNDINVYRWEVIAFEVQQYLKMFSSEPSLRFVYEPFTIGQAHRNAMGYHVAVGVIFGIAQKIIRRFKSKCPLLAQSRRSENHLPGEVVSHL